MVFRQLYNLQSDSPDNLSTRLAPRIVTTMLLTIFPPYVVLYTPTHQLFRELLFSFHIFGVFPDIFLLLVLNLILLWPENILCMVWIVLNLSSFVLWLRMRSSLANIICALKKKKCMLLLLGEVFSKYQLVKLVDSVVQRFYIFTDCLLGLIIVRRVFNSLTKTGGI